jgi:predicted RNase H-like HicB family nuclease
MKQKVASYTVVIEKETRTGTKKTCFSAYVPLLGVATEANSVAEVRQEIKNLVQFHIESLASEGEEIPVEKEKSIITMLSAILPKNAQIATN